MRTNVPRTLRALRRRRAWRQVDLAQRAHVARDLVQRAEGHRLGGVTIASLDRLAQALHAHLAVELRWRGAELDRLIDARHAAVGNVAARRLERSGWVVHSEVSFNHFGDRGRCDLVAWHPATRTLLILEVKSLLGDLQDALGQLDVKVRLGATIAAQLGLGRPARVVGGFVLAANGANRRVVQRHDALFRRFDTRGRVAFAWLRRPGRTGRTGLTGPLPASSGSNCPMLDEASADPLGRPRQCPGAGLVQHQASAGPGDAMRADLVQHQAQRPLAPYRPRSTAPLHGPVRAARGPPPAGLLRFELPDAG